MWQVGEKSLYFAYAVLLALSSIVLITYMAYGLCVFPARLIQGIEDPLQTWQLQLTAVEEQKAAVMSKYSSPSRSQRMSSKDKNELEKIARQERSIRRQIRMYEDLNDTFIGTLLGYGKPHQVE